MDSGRPEQQHCFLPAKLQLFYHTGYVVKDMEMRSLAVKFDDSWVVNTMRLAQVPLLQLLLTYDKLYKAKVSLKNKYRCICIPLSEAI